MTNGERMLKTVNDFIEKYRASRSHTELEDAGLDMAHFLVSNKSCFLSELLPPEDLAERTATLIAAELKLLLRAHGVRLNGRNVRNPKRPGQPESATVNVCRTYQNKPAVAVSVYGDESQTFLTNLLNEHGFIYQDHTSRYANRLMCVLITGKVIDAIPEDNNASLSEETSPVS